MQTTEINKLGKELELYTYIDYIGKGFPIILPKGAKIINLIRNYVEKEEEKNGFEVVRTPSISRAEIYKIEDRFKEQKDEMFIIKSNDEEDNSIVLRPYSIPFHCTIYKTKQRSYKMLPLKISETSSVFRNERDIKGISRTRQITLSDASIFLAKEDLEKEIIESLNLQIKFINKLGLEVKFEISNWNDTKKEDYIGTIEEWDYAVKCMKNALETLKIPYEENKKAKMYGPSINLYYANEEFSSMQIDFEIVHRFDLNYTNKENEEKFPIYIHRTSVGSYENLLSILIEKYKGDFPIWIAPLQVTIIPEKEEYEDFAKKIEEQLLENRIRVNIDISETSIQNKEEKAMNLKIPYIVKIGKEEYNNNKISVRKKEKVMDMNIDELIKEVLSC